MKKGIYTLALSLLILAVTIPFGSCGSRESVCKANGQYQSVKKKKNKSGYNTRYAYKSKPVKKHYIIRNSR